MPQIIPFLLLLVLITIIVIIYNVRSRYVLPKDIEMIFTIQVSIFLFTYPLKSTVYMFGQESHFIYSAIFIGLISCIGLVIKSAACNDKLPSKYIIVFNFCFCLFISLILSSDYISILSVIHCCTVYILALSGLELGGTILFFLPIWAHTEVFSNRTNTDRSNNSISYISNLLEMSSYSTELASLSHRINNGFSVIKEINLRFESLRDKAIYYREIQDLQRDQYYSALAKEERLNLRSNLVSLDSNINRRSSLAIEAQRLFPRASFNSYQSISPEDNNILGISRTLAENPIHDV